MESAAHHAALVARLSAAEKEVTTLRHANATLRRQLRGRAEDAAPLSSAAALRRAILTAEKAATDAENAARRRGSAPQDPPPILDVEEWLHTLELHKIVGKKICEALSRRRSDYGGRSLERPFLEALGVTNREVVIELVRELPINELLCDAVREGAIAVE